MHANNYAELAHGGTGAAAVGGGATAVSAAFGVNEMIALAGVLATFTALIIGIYFHHKQFKLAQQAFKAEKQFREDELSLMRRTIVKTMDKQDKERND